MSKCWKITLNLPKLHLKGWGSRTFWVKSQKMLDFSPWQQGFAFVQSSKVWHRCKGRGIAHKITLVSPLYNNSTGSHLLMFVDPVDRHDWNFEHVTASWNFIGSADSNKGDFPIYKWRPYWQHCECFRSLRPVITNYHRFHKLKVFDLTSQQVRKCFFIG